MTLRFFNVSSPGIVWRCRLWKLWNAFNRHYDPTWAADNDEPKHQWGFGLLQSGHRHLFYVGHAYAYVLFVCVWSAK